MTRRLALVALLCAAAAPAAAQTGGGYDLTWNTIDGGGGTATGGTYAMTCTIGQPDAAVFAGGPYTLGGGFWKGGSGGITGIGDDLLTRDLPRVFALHAPAPNPFTEAATVRFDLPRAGQVRMRVYDTRGAMVREVVDARLPAGRYARTWDGCDGRGHAVAGGVYYLRLDADAARAERRVVVMR